jgi:hypothetical protein
VLLPSTRSVLAEHQGNENLVGNVDPFIMEDAANFATPGPLDTGSAMSADAQAVSLGRKVADYRLGHSFQPVA